MQYSTSTYSISGPKVEGGKQGSFVHNRVGVKGRKKDVNRFLGDMVRKITHARLELEGYHDRKGRKGGVGERAADVWGLNVSQRRW